MIYIYLLILFILLALIITFRNYKQEHYKSFDKKQAPLFFIYGFCMLLCDVFSRLSKSNKKQKIEDLQDKLKVISFGVTTFMILIFFGLLTCIKIPKNESTEKLISEESSFTYSEETSSMAETTPDKYAQIKDTISLFEKYRADIEDEFLGENTNFLSINKPLNLLTKYGDEPILINWTFETENIINKDGTINYSNISSDGCQTMAYANLSFGDAKATLSIPIFICPPK